MSSVASLGSVTAVRRPFRTFIGVDLGGGKGKTTALTRLRWEAAAAGGTLIVEDGGGARSGSSPGGSATWYDDRLVEYLLAHRAEAVVAMDAPLTLPACVRCQLAACPSVSACEVPTVRWFRTRSEAAQKHAKPKYTPYTQRATEVVLHEDHGIMPRETLGQGMGPLTARMVYLRHALSGTYVLNDNLLEVYPKATLTQLFPDPEPASTATLGVRYRDGNGHAIRVDGQADNRPDAGRRLASSQVARHYKRSGHAQHIRERVLSELAALAGVSELRFGPGQWREFVLQNDHQFDSLICAFTAFLWATKEWTLPADSIFAEDGWIWFPPRGGVVKT